MFIEEENFQELIVICENFTLKLFTLGIKKIALSKYFKVDKHVKEDNSLVVVMLFCQALVNL